MLTKVTEKVQPIIKRKSHKRKQMQLFRIINDYGARTPR